MHKSYIIFLLIGLVSCKQEIAEQASPNIIFILADDMGYSDIGCFGGEISTPNIDQLATNGIRFANFYNSSRCCPSRASLITGQYPHQVGMGCMVDWPPSAEEGAYQGYLNHDQVTIANSLKSNGYSTYMVGKWHLGENPEHWPLQHGFDKYFGLISGASSYFELIKNQERERKMAYNKDRWEPPAEGFYMTSAFSDSAASFIAKHNTENPFFMYLAYTAPHWPLHALEKDIVRFEELYLQGWDRLYENRFERMKAMGVIDKNISSIPAKPTSIPDWETLTVAEKKNQARLMAVYAAMIYRMDLGIGKVIETLKEKGVYENTVIMFASDNGATDANISGRKLNDSNVPIGARGSYVAYREPWAWMSNTPYQKYKMSSYWGGMRTPFIISYPKLTEGKQQLSHQVGHFIDVLPTILAFTQTAKPDGYTPEGIDLTDIVASPDSTKLSPRPIFMEHMGNKTVIFEHWKLLKTTAKTAWALYDLSNDPMETKDVSGKHLKKVKELETMYLKWEARTGSYSLPTKYLPENK
jgi:arylsulfatase